MRVQRAHLHGCPILEGIDVKWNNKIRMPPFCKHDSRGRHNLKPSKYLTSGLNFKLVTKIFLFSSPWGGGEQELKIQLQERNQNIATSGEPAQPEGSSLSLKSQYLKCSCLAIVCIISGTSQKRVSTLILNSTWNLSPECFTVSKQSLFLAI